jgi:hypothetical protein
MKMESFYDKKIDIFIGLKIKFLLVFLFLLNNLFHSKIINKKKYEKFFDLNDYFSNDNKNNNFSLLVKRDLNYYEQENKFLFERNYLRGLQNNNNKSANNKTENVKNPSTIKKNTTTEPEFNIAKKPKDTKNKTNVILIKNDSAFEVIKIQQDNNLVEIGKLNTPKNNNTNTTKNNNTNTNTNTNSDTNTNTNTNTYKNNTNSNTNTNKNNTNTNNNNNNDINKLIEENKIKTNVISPNQIKNLADEIKKIKTDKSTNKNNTNKNTTSSNTINKNNTYKDINSTEIAIFSVTVIGKKYKTKYTKKLKLN